MIASRMILATCAALLTVGCQFRLTRPPGYDGSTYCNYPSDSPRVDDLNKLFERYPELKGLVVSAPEYNVEVERERQTPPLTTGSSERDPLQVVQAGDILSVEVQGEPDFTKTVIVSVGGLIDYPHVGTVVAKGQTLEQLASFLRKKIETYFPAAHVTVNRDATVHPFSCGGTPAPKTLLLGSMRELKTIPFVETATLAQVMAQAGWFVTNEEWRAVRVVRPRHGHTRGRIIVSDMQAYSVYGDTMQDFPLNAGDVVFIGSRWRSAEATTKDWGVALQYLAGNLSLDQLLCAWTPRVPLFHMPPLPRHVW